MSQARQAVWRPRAAPVSVGVTGTIQDKHETTTGRTSLTARVGRKLFGLPKEFLTPGCQLGFNPPPPQPVSLASSPRTHKAVRSGV